MNVVITGGSSGIGRAVATEFARAGARVGLVARHPDRLEQAAADVRRAGGTPFVAPADVADRARAEEAMRRFEAEMGGVDVLVNNAGRPGRLPFADLPVEEIEHVMRVNYLGAVYCIKALLPGMLARGSGIIVNVASIAGRIGVPRSGAYAASKFALVGLSESLAAELAPQGIRVLLVNPGPVRTESFPHLTVNPRLVLDPEVLGRAIARAVRRGTPERTIPRYYRAADVLRVLAPPLYRAVLHRFAATRPDSISPG